MHKRVFLAATVAGLLSLAIGVASAQEKVDRSVLPIAEVPWFRFFGPEKALFDKSWKMPDIERIN